MAGFILSALFARVPIRTMELTEGITVKDGLSGPMDPIILPGDISYETPSMHVLDNIGGQDTGKILPAYDDNDGGQKEPVSQAKRPEVGEGRAPQQNVTAVAVSDIKENKDKDLSNTVLSDLPAKQHHSGTYNVSKGVHPPLPDSSAKRTEPFELLSKTPTPLESVNKDGLLKNCWNTTWVSKEVIYVKGHRRVLHYWPNFIILRNYPVTENPYNCFMYARKKIKMCPMEERVKYLHDKCIENKMLRWDEMPEGKFRTEELPNLLVDEQHKILYCQSLKKSETNLFLKYFGLASGKETDMKKVPIFHMENMGMKDIRAYEPGQIIKMLRDYTKLIIVRHPYHRLINVWGDDFREDGEWSRWDLGPKIIRGFHGEGAYKHGDMISFKDYVRYTLGELGEPESYYGARNFDACKPCLVGYDFIRRIETGPLDSEPLLKKMGIYENEAIKKAEIHHGLRQINSYISQYIGLSRELHDKIRKYYRLDMELFGYHYDDFRATCEIKRKNGSICC